MGSVKKYYSRLFRLPKASFFLFGPRGVGKSTFLQHQFPKGLLIDLLLSQVKRILEVNPENLINMVEGHSPEEPIILDEIQRVPELLSIVHHLIEKKKGWHFILTGSSARKIRRTGVDLLGGRARKRTLHPFMAKELGDDFDLQH